MAEIIANNGKQRKIRKLVKINTGPYGQLPLKIKILKIGLRSDLSWAKVGLEPKYHEPGSFGGFGKREQTNRQTDKIHVL